MKKIIIFILCALPILTFSQIQIGNDIDGEATFDSSGFSVSLSSDGSVVAIGANRNGNFRGHVRIYQNQSGIWTQLGNDIDGEGASDQSGYSVSLSSDGMVVAIGARFNNDNGSQSGHVRVYQNQSGIWTQIGSDIDGQAVSGQSGYSVSLSSDGTVVAIGAPTSNSNGDVRIYQNQSNTWTLLGSAIIGNALSDQFGNSVSLSSDGTVVAIGAFGNDDNGNLSGQVKIYQNQSGIWTKIGSNINGEATGNYFGWSVSLSSDGSVVAIGAILNTGNGTNSGHVRIYENQSGTWTKIGNDIDGEVAEDQSGYSVSLSSNGNIVAIGARQNDGNGTDSGHVRIYQNQSGTWTQIGSDIDGEAAYNYLGHSVSLSSDGTTVAIGAIYNSDNGNSSGQVRVYDLSGLALSSNSFNKDYFSIYPNPVKNELNINLNKGLELKQVNIYNLQSQYLYSVKTLKIDVRNLSSGLYFIEVETNQGKSAKKIVVE